MPAVTCQPMSKPNRLLVFLRREAAWLVVGVALGFGALPWLLYQVGSRTLGPYEGGGEAMLWQTLYGDFLRLRPAAWLAGSSCSARLIEVSTSGPRSNRPEMA